MMMSDLTGCLQRILLRHQMGWPRSDKKLFGGTKRNFWLASVFLFILLESPTSGHCPDHCVCKWKGGKETVECLNATLSRIPSLDTTTQVLDLSFNNLLRINENVFRDRNLYNLQKIYLKHCSIHVVIGRCFEGITNLVELDLSWNLLQTIPKEALKDCRYLMTLSLRGNPIRKVHQDTFDTLKDLQTLDLSQCQLTEIDSQSFYKLNNLHWLKLDNNLLAKLQPEFDFPAGLRGVSLHSNKWMCDCELIDFQNFLVNKSVPYEAEPYCSEPDRISGQLIKDLSENELACIPQVSPTATYQEIIQGKNMTLVCTVMSVPNAKISWWYHGLFINNGSTMVSDIDMRPYYYKNTDLGHGTVKSELILLRTNLDDNGTFQCIAENRAGIAVANFTLNVVIPVPPKPPQDVVEERFQKEYLIAIGIAAVIVSILTTVIVILLAIKCRGIRRRRSQSYEEAKIHLYQNSVSGSDISSEVSLRAIQPTKLNGSLVLTDQEEIGHIDSDSFSNSDSKNISDDTEKLVGPDIISHTNGLSMKHRRKIIAIPVDKGDHAPQGYRELSYSESYHEAFLTQPLENLSPLKDPKNIGELPKEPREGNLPPPAQKLSPPTPFADTKPVNCCFTKYKSTAEQINGTAGKNELCPTVQVPNEGKPLEILLGNNLNQQGAGSISFNSHQFSTLQRVSRSNSQSGSDCENNKGSLRKDRMKSNPEKWHFSTLPRKNLVTSLSLNNNDKDCNSAQLCKTDILTQKSFSGDSPKFPKSKSIAADISLQLLESLPVLPPPPSFKSVHFAPNVSEGDSNCPPIPTEGLPKGPAKENKSIEFDHLVASPLGASSRVPCTERLPERNPNEKPAEDKAKKSTNASTKKCDFVIPKSEIIPIKLRSRDQAINK